MWIVVGILFLVVGITILSGHFAFSITPAPSTDAPASLGTAYSDIYFINYNDELLHGWWMQHPDASAESPLPTIILLHGWNRNCQRMIPYIKHLSMFPMNILCIEGRGHGENRKNNFITQVGFAHDILSAINWLVLQPGVQVEQIGVLGHSLGAAAAIYAGSLDKRIRFIIADASYAHPLTIIRNFLRGYHIPYLPLGWMLIQYIQLRLWLSLDRIAPENVICDLTQPVLLIHGDQDTIVPARDSQRLLTNANNNIDLWIARSANHSDTPDHPEFRAVLQGFFRTHLKFSDPLSLSIARPENTSATSDNPTTFN
ncbi:MAG TPA: alpha/beta hydrolase [bacterium]|nr:alpha/beta hydrolase [bacterium]